MSETWGLITGVLISTALTWFIAWWFYRRGFAAKTSHWAVRSTPVIVQRPTTVKALEVRYRGQEVDTVTVSTILFWNAGRGTLDETDVVKADPPRILTRDSVAVLDAMIVEVNNPSNGLTLVPGTDNRSLIISFGYLNNGDGAVIRVIHTGTSSKDVYVTGSLKGVKAITRARSFESTRAAVVFLSLFATLAVMLAGLPWLSQLPPVLQRLHPVLQLIVGVSLAFVPIVVSGAVSIWLVNGTRIGRPPKGLDTFERDD